MSEMKFSNEMLPNVERIFIFANYYNKDGSHTTVAKQYKRFSNSGDVEILDVVNSEFYDWLLRLIDEHNIDYICFVPNSQSRMKNLFDELKVKLSESFYVVDLVKIKTGTHPMTYSSSDISSKTKVVENKFEDEDYQQGLHSGNVLVIDDIVGSGSTVKVITNLLKRKNPDAKIFVAGLAA
jgi:predicted amidophosphoribosyltransferase